MEKQFSSSELNHHLKLMHLITSLDRGGAEIMLCRLMRQIDRSRFDNRVICMIHSGEVGEMIQRSGIPVTSLEMHSGTPSLGALKKMVGILHKETPDLLLTWMYHADLLGSLSVLFTHTPILWGVRNTSLDKRYVKPETIRVAHWNALLSHWIPRKVIICSNDARAQHIQIGYKPGKFVTIPNGFDLEQLQTNPSAHLSLREELSLDREVVLIGLIARFDPLKDHQTFTKAAGILLKKHPQVHFLLCGRKITWENITLQEWIDAAGPRSNFHLLGQRDDIPYIMNGLDVNTLSSSGEAFPNVIGEAMACGVPCVSTDVGDTAYLIGDTGITVRPQDPLALAKGWERLLEMKPHQLKALGERARQRIQKNFGIEHITRRYEQIYSQTLSELQ